MIVLNDEQSELVKRIMGDHASNEGFSMNPNTFTDEARKFMCEVFPSKDNVWKKPVMFQGEFGKPPLPLLSCPEYNNRHAKG